MNDVEKLKQVKEALEYCKAMATGGMSSFRDCVYGKCVNTLPIIDELIDQQAKGVDVLTEVEMAQVAGVLFNAGHEELSKKTYSALKAGQPKDQYNSGDVFVWDGVTLRPWYSMPVEVLEMVLEWEAAGKPSQPKAPSVSEGDIQAVAESIYVEFTRSPCCADDLRDIAWSTINAWADTGTESAIKVRDTAIAEGKAAIRALSERGIITTKGEV